ncbi:MAG: class I adenylate-forming enzyme family protein [Burkholderiaceae bacterium]
MNRLLTLLQPESASRYYANGAWRRDTFYTLLQRHASERPADWALRDARQRLSWSALLAWVDSVAQSLHDSGVRPGQRICVGLPSRVESVVVFLACSRNGYVCNPSLHQNYTVAEITRLLERCRCAALFMQVGYGADAKREDLLVQALGLPHLKAVYQVAAPQASDGRGRPFPSATLSQPLSLAVATDPDKVVYLAFTSGTTGEPKGVMHSDNTLLANGRAMVSDWAHDSSTVLLSLSPMSHHIGTVALEQMMVAGCELVLNDLPQGSTTLDWIEACGASYIMGVPTHAIDVLDQMRRRGLTQLGGVRLFYMAGSTIPRDVAQSFLDMGITPQNIYGMTENGSHQYTLPTDDATTIVETCGRACHGYETRIFNQDNPDLEVDAGTIGEIGTRGALLMLGYFGNQFGTEDAFNRAGWFLSGDLGVLDERGCLSIMGRKKDLIIRGGHNIHPSRIEDLAHRHPAVQKAAAFAVADVRLGERACLAVMLRQGSQLVADDLLEHLNQAGLSKYDMPEYFVALDEMPLTASGKILKRELQEWVKIARIVPEPVRWNPPSKGN